MSTIQTAGLTRLLARYPTATRLADIPPEVRREGVRAFHNVLGCALGGAREKPMLALAEARSVETGAVSGADFLLALILWIEIECRVANIRVIPPESDKFCTLFCPVLPQSTAMADDTSQKSRSGVACTSFIKPFQHVRLPGQFVTLAIQTRKESTSVTSILHGCSPCRLSVWSQRTLG